VAVLLALSVLFDTVAVSQRFHLVAVLLALSVLFDTVAVSQRVHFVAVLLPLLRYFLPQPLRLVFDRVLELGKVGPVDLPLLCHLARNLGLMLGARAVIGSVDCFIHDGRLRHA
jgi:hypothetical protein